VIAVDTNVLVRIVLGDDPAQARVAERLFIRARTEQTTLFVADVVLCELVWVLTRRTGLSRAQIAGALEQLMRTELITVADSGVVDRAARAYRGGKGDFADYLIREHATAAGATEIVTFDRILRAEEGFRLLGAKDQG
jgi:predicted nucleic-acid-binding protein